MTALLIFGIGSSLNRWAHQLATIGTNAICCPTRQEHVTDFVSQILLHKIICRSNFFAVVQYAVFFSYKEIFPEGETELFKSTCWFSVLYTVM
jgi:hypothetical protein